jgi:SNF2 family DNA or RNA helicase
MSSDANIVTIPEVLFDYQSEDSERLANEIPRGILGSEMGTGKTEVFLGLVHTIQPKRVLIAAPKIMVLEWRDRIALRMNEEASVPYGVVKKNFNGYGLSADHFKTRFLIVNHEMLRMKRYMDILKLIKWDLIGYDEAHRFKNKDAKQTKGAKTLSKLTDRLIHITGTPFLNYPNELWSLLNMLDPKSYPNYWDFTKEYCYTIPSPWGPRIVGAKKSAMPKLRGILDKIMVRRELKDVLPDLPRKLDPRIIEVDFSREQDAAYKMMEKQFVALLADGEKLMAPKMLGRLMRLRQLALDPSLIGSGAPSAKTKVLLELIEDSKPSKVVVFSWFAGYLRNLYDTMDPETTMIIHGQQDAETRRSERLRFQEDPDVKLAFVSIAAGGVGIDLIASHIGIFTDVFWTPGINAQAEARLHRIGQTENVSIIKLVAPNTIDDDMNKLLAKKAEAFDQSVAVKRAVTSMLDRHGTIDFSKLEPIYAKERQEIIDDIKVEDGDWKVQDNLELQAEAIGDAMDIFGGGEEEEEL